MISSWILNIIDPRLPTSVAYADTAISMWETLKKRFAITTGPKIHQLKANIANCKEEGLSVVGFYSKITNLWVELGNHVKVPYCTCGGCICGAANKFVQMYKRRRHISS